MSPRTHWPGLSATMMTMSRMGDLDLNHAPAPAPAAAALLDSMKDGLRQAMLQHETIFKNQVRELHRLYWTQKSLMSDACWKRSAPVSAAAKSRCGSAEVNDVGGVLMPQGMLSEFRMSRHRDFDLEAPAIGFDGELAEEVADELLEVKGPASDQSDTAGVGREGGNRDDGDTDHGTSCGNGRFIIDLEAPVEMELDEDPSAICSSGLKCLQASGVNVNGLRDDGFSGFNSASGWRNDSSHQLFEGHYHADHQRENWLKNSSVQADFGSSRVSISGSVQSVSPSTQKCQPTPKYLHIDLNIAQDGLTADVCPEPMHKFPSLSPSSSFVVNGDHCRKSDGKCPNYTEPSSEYRTQTNSTLPDLVSLGSEKWMYNGLKDDHNFIRQSSELSSTVVGTAWSHEKSALDMEVQRFGTKSPVEFCRNSMERISSTSNGGTQNSTNGIAISFLGFHKHRDEKVFSSLGQQQVNMHIISGSGASNVTCSNEVEENCLHPSTESTNLIPATDERSGRKQTSDVRNEEDTVSSRAISSCEQGDQNKKSSDCNKLDLLSESTESTTNINSTEKPRTTSVPDNYRVVIEALKPEGLCSNDPLSDICASNPEESEHQQALVPEMDFMIVKAAETLLSIALEDSALPYNFSCDGQAEFVTDEDKSQPQFTSDSFEEMTLKLEEIEDDGSSVTSKQLEMESRKESCGIKLRRGRGLRDFQKDILPGLVSLSRHEICEDMHAIKHELRKNRSHITCDGSFLTPVRSRRSRIYSACRRS